MSTERQRNLAKHRYSFGEVIDWDLLIIGFATIWGSVVWVLVAAVIKLL